MWLACFLAIVHDYERVSDDDPGGAEHEHGACNDTWGWIHPTVEGLPLRSVATNRRVGLPERSCPLGS